MIKMNLFEESVPKENMLSVFYSRYKRWNIFSQYSFALFAYAFPFVSLFLFFVDQASFNLTGMFLWVIFLLSLGPCGLIGLLLCSWGLFKAYSKNSRINKTVGFWGIFLGIGGIVGGILTLMLIYVIVN